MTAGPVAACGIRSVYGVASVGVAAGHLRCRTDDDARVVVQMLQYIINIAADLGSEYGVVIVGDVQSQIRAERVGALVETAQIELELPHEFPLSDPVFGPAAGGAHKVDTGASDGFVHGGHDLSEHPASWFEEDPAGVRIVVEPGGLLVDATAEAP